MASSLDRGPSGGWREGLSVLATTLLPVVLATSAVAAETTTTTGTGATAVTETGSQYGFASFLFFLALAVGVLWLVRR
jgi:hypothetical protein